MPADEYHRIQALSASGLKELRKSPAHFWSWLHNPPKSSDALTFGTAFHCALLEPAKFAETYCTAPRFDGRTKEGKAAKAEWEATHQGYTPLDSGDMHTIRGMQKSLLQHTIAGPMLFGGRSEVSVFGSDEETGVAMKARIDRLTDDLIIDIKTTDDASVRGFGRSVFTFGYDIQAAHYMEMTGRNRFVFMAVEKVEPFAVALYELDSQVIEAAKIERRERIKLYASCLEMDFWPAYRAEIQTISLPTWAKKSEINNNN
jgi:hypothetical protein